MGKSSINGFTRAKRFHLVCSIQQVSLEISKLNIAFYCVLLYKSSSTLINTVFAVVLYQDLIEPLVFDEDVSRVLLQQWKVILKFLVPINGKLFSYC